ncbi:ABC transporter substrate-binding protein [Companilactobacillus kimchiensis]|nr:extracellular solute-binding protein [Companilactobacillus kimchiensis]
MANKIRIFTTVITLLSFGIILTGCHKESKATLTIRTSDKNTELMSKEIIKPYSKKYKVSVNQQTDSTSSLHQRIDKKDLNADVIELNQSDTVAANDKQLFKKIDFKKLKNFKYLSSDNQKLAKKTNSIPYSVETTNIVYNKGNNLENGDFTRLWDQQNDGKIALPDTENSLWPAIIYMGIDYSRFRSTSSYVGHDFADEGPALAALKELQPKVMIYDNVAELSKLFKDGRVNLAVVDSDTAITLKKNISSLNSTTLGLNVYANYQMAAIPKNCQNIKAAYQYLDYRLSQSVQSRASKKMQALPVNQSVQKIDSNYATYGSGSDYLVTMDYEYINAQRNKLIKEWNQIFK